MNSKKIIFTILMWHVIFVGILVTYIVNKQILDYYISLVVAKGASSENRSGKNIPAYIITIPDHDHRVPFVSYLFRKYAGLKLDIFYGINGKMRYSDKIMTIGKKTKVLTAGEQGLRETMRQFYTMAHESNFSQVFSFEDDAIPHVNFSKLIKQLDNRCRRADVLLLGASLWHKNQTHWPSGVCFDADNRTFGSHALMVKRQAFTSIISWLETGPQLPFDHIYQYLQDQGKTVRVAFPPFLAIPDVLHVSTIRNNRSKVQFNITERAAVHRWNLTDYPVISIPTHFKEARAVP